MTEIPPPDGAPAENRATPFVPQQRREGDPPGSGRPEDLRDLADNGVPRTEPTVSPRPPQRGEGPQGQPAEEEEAMTEAEAAAVGTGIGAFEARREARAAVQRTGLEPPLTFAIPGIDNPIDISQLTQKHIEQLTGPQLAQAVGDILAASVRDPGIPLNEQARSQLTQLFREIATESAKGYDILKSRIGAEGPEFDQDNFRSILVGMLTKLGFTLLISLFKEGLSAGSPQR